jgi:hypothetical protein
MRRSIQLTDDDSDRPSPLMTIREAKRDRGKASATRLLMHRDTLSNMPAPESEARPSIPTNGPDGLSAARDHTPITGPSAIDEMIQRVLEKMLLAQAPVKKRGLRAWAHDINRGEDGDDEDEVEVNADESLRREQALAMRMGIRHMHLEKVREWFKHALNIGQDKDIVKSPSASRQDVHAYEQEVGEGPDPRRIIFDMKGPLDSRWNIEALQILQQSFEDAIQAKERIVARCEGQSQLYWQDAFTNRLKRLRRQWDKGQFKVKPSGERESNDEWQLRVVQEEQDELKKARHLSRRTYVGIAFISEQSLF